jgi:hypothetical protein
MNNQEKYHDDHLWEYLSPEKREKTTGGFTSKVMTRVGLETTPLKESLRNRNLIPYISSLVIILLIAAVFLIPESDTDLISTTLISFLKGIKFSVPVINLSSLFQLSIPAVITYAFIGILVLTVLDRALYGFFKKEK